MTTETEPRATGWLHSPPDPRDYQLYQYRPDLLVVELPASVDLRGVNQPPIQNQGSLGSCVAWACCRAYRYVQRKTGFPDFDGSELFTYYGARELGGFPTTQDTGAYLRDGIKTLAQNGNAIEAAWPYDVTQFAQRPSQAAYASATAHQATRYLSVPNMQTSVKQVLASGYPVVFGIPIYQNFPMGNGVEVIPDPVGQVIGGHAMCVVGYDDARGAYLLANSWGPAWGNQGFAWMSYNYFGGQAADLWMIETVEGEAPTPPPPPVPPANRAFRLNRFIHHEWLNYLDTGEEFTWVTSGTYN